MYKNEQIIFNLIDSFSNKKDQKTGNETLANYINGNLEAGGNNGDFYTHINYHTMKQSLLELIKQNKKSYMFVETGCSAQQVRSL